MTTVYGLASRFLGLKEGAGHANNPQVLAMLQLDSGWASSDEVPWCSAFVNYIAWLLDLPRSKSLAARSWLAIGTPVASVYEAKVGSDVVVFKRGTGPQPGPEVLDAPGHVGFYGGLAPSGLILVLGGNQGDAVSLSAHQPGDLLGIRRLA